MRPYIFKVAASTEEQVFFGKANYARLDPSSTVSVKIKAPDNNEEITLDAGDDVILSEFDELRISHDGASDTAFTLYVGLGTKAGSSKVSGNIQPVGGSDNTANPPGVIKVPDTLSSSHFYTGISGALITIVTPAANLNGVKIHGCGIFTTGATASRYMHKTSAPTSTVDTSAGTIATSSGSSVAPIGNDNTTLYETKIIPAGRGVYLQQTGIATLYAWLEYEVL